LFQGTVRTIAGGGSSITLAGGVPAATIFLLFNLPGFAADPQGNLYFGISAYLWKVDFNGNLTAIAGNGAGIYSGDGGAATSAQITSPSAVAFDGHGNMFIAENGTRVRKVDSGGVITTIAGTGTSGDTGDNGPAVAAQLRIDGMAADKAG